MENEPKNAINPPQNIIKTIILAAGKGTRMKSQKPKVLHEIFKKPLLAWVIDSIKPVSEEYITVLGSGFEQAKDYLSKSYPDAKIALQKEQKGTGHAVLQASSLLDNFKGNVLVTCGDTPLLKTLTLENFINYHIQNNSDLTVMTANFDNPTGYGRIVCSSNNNVNKIIEEKDANPEQKQIKEVNAGVYLFKWEKIKDALTELKNNNSQGEYYLTDIVQWANSKKYKVLGFNIENNTEIYGINSKENLAKAFNLMKEGYNKYLMEKGVTIVDPNSTYISPETEVGSDTVIYPNTYIEGKNKIASNCSIGPMAHLRGDCIIEEGCKIGNFVELKKVEISSYTNVGHLTYVGDAKIGSRVNVGAGTIFANYNSITKEKKQSILKDGVSIGSNSVIVAPVMLEENAFVAAGTVVTKSTEKNSLIINRAPQREIKNWVENTKLAHEKAQKSTKSKGEQNDS